MKKSSKKFGPIKALAITSAVVGLTTSLFASTSAPNTKIENTNKLASEIIDTEITNEPQSLQVSPRNSDEQLGSTFARYNIDNGYSSNDFKTMYAYEFAANKNDMITFIRSHFTQIFGNINGITKDNLMLEEDSVQVHQARGEVIFGVYLTAYNFNNVKINSQSRVFYFKFTGFTRLSSWDYANGDNNMTSWFRWKSRLTIRDKLPAELFNQLSQVKITRNNAKTILPQIHDYIDFGPIPYQIPDYELIISGVPNNITGSVDLVFKTNYIFKKVGTDTVDYAVIKTSDFNRHPFTFRTSSVDYNVNFLRKGITDIASTMVDLKRSNINQKYINAKDIVDRINKGDETVINEIKAMVLAQITPPVGVNYSANDLTFAVDEITSVPASGIVSIPITIKNFVSVNAINDKKVTFIFAVNPLSVPFVNKSKTFPALYPVEEAVNLIKKDLAKANLAEQNFIRLFLDITGVNYTQVKVSAVNVTELSKSLNKAKFEFVIENMPNLVPGEPTTSTQKFGPWEYQFFSNRLETYADPLIALSPQDELDTGVSPSSLYPFQAAEKNGATYKYDEKLRTFLMERAINNKAILPAGNKTDPIIDASKYSPEDIEIVNIKTIDNALGEYEIEYNLKRYVEYVDDNPVYHSGNGSLKCSTIVKGFKRAYAPSNIQVNPQYAKEFKDTLPSVLKQQINDAANNPDTTLTIFKKLLLLYNHPLADDNGIIIDDSFKNNLSLTVLEANDSKGQIKIKVQFNGYFLNDKYLSFSTKTYSSNAITLNFLQNVPSATQITSEVVANNNLYENYLASEVESELARNNTELLDQIKNDILNSIKYQPNGFTVDNITNISVSKTNPNHHLDEKWVNLDITINNFYDGATLTPITGTTKILKTKFFANFREIQPTRFNPGTYQVPGVKDKQAREWYLQNGDQGIKNVLAQFIADQYNKQQGAPTILVGDLPMPKPITADEIIITNVRPDDRRARIDFDASLKRYWEYDRNTLQTTLVQNNDNGYRPYTRIRFRGFYSPDVTLIPGDNAEYFVDQELAKFYPSDLTFEGNDFTLQKVQEFIYNSGRTPVADENKIILDGKLPTTSAKDNVVIKNTLGKEGLTFVGQPNDKDGTLKIVVHLKNVFYIDPQGTTHYGDPKDPTLTDFTIILKGFKKRLPTKYPKNINNNELGADFDTLIPTEIQKINKEQGIISKVLYDATTKKIKTTNNPLIQGEYPTETSPKAYKNQAANNQPNIQPEWEDPYINNLPVAEENRVVYNDVGFLNNRPNIDGRYKIILTHHAWYDADDGLPVYSNVSKQPKKVEITVNNTLKIEPTQIAPGPYRVNQNGIVAKKLPQLIYGYLLKSPHVDADREIVLKTLEQEIYDNVILGSKRDITVDDIHVNLYRTDDTDFDPNLNRIPNAYDNLRGSLKIEIQVDKSWGNDGEFLDYPRKRIYSINGLRTATPTNPYKGIQNIGTDVVLAPLTTDLIINMINKPKDYNSPTADKIRQRIKEYLWHNVQGAGFIHSNTQYLNIDDIEFVEARKPIETQYKREVIVKYKLNRYWNNDADFIDTKIMKGTQPAIHELWFTGLSEGNATDIVSPFNIYGKKYSLQLPGLKFGFPLDDPNQIASLSPEQKVIYEASSQAHTISPNSWINLLPGNTEAEKKQKAQRIFKEMIIINKEFIIQNTPPGNLDDNIQDVRITKIDDKKGTIETEIRFKKVINTEGQLVDAKDPFTFVIEGFAKVGETLIKDQSAYDISGKLLNEVTANEILASLVTYDPATQQVMGGGKDITTLVQAFIRENAIEGYAPANEITADDIYIYEIKNQSNINKSISIKFGLKKFFNEHGDKQTLTNIPADIPDNKTKTITLNGFFSMNSELTIPPQDVVNLSTGLLPNGEGDSGVLFSYFYDETNTSESKYYSNVFDDSGAAVNPDTNKDQAIEHLKKWILHNTQGTKEGITLDDIVITGEKEGYAFTDYNLLKGTLTIQYKLTKYWTSTGPSKWPSPPYSLTITGFKRGKVTEHVDKGPLSLLGAVGTKGVTQAFVDENESTINKLKLVAVEEIITGSSDSVTVDELKETIRSFVYHNVHRGGNDSIIENVNNQDLTKEDFRVENVFLKGGDVVAKVYLKKYYNEEGKEVTASDTNLNEWFEFSIVLTDFPKNEETDVLEKARLDISRSTGPLLTAGKRTFYKEIITPLIVDENGASREGSDFYWKDATPTTLKRSIVENSNGFYSESQAEVIIRQTIAEVIMDNMVFNNTATSIDDISLDFTYNDAAGTMKIDFIVTKGYQKNNNGVAVVTSIKKKGHLEIFGFKKDNRFETSDLTKILTYSISGVAVFCVLAIILFIVYKRRRDIEYRQ